MGFGLGDIGSIVEMGTDILGGAVEAGGAVHAAETGARAGQAALETQRQATGQAIAGLGYQTAPQRGIGTLALYQIASMLGIDPRMAFGGGGTALGPGPGAPSGGGGLFGAPSTGGLTGTQDKYDRGPFGGSGLAGFHGDPLGVFKDYSFSPSFADSSALMGGIPQPGAPGSEFGQFRRGFSLEDFFNNMDPAYGFRMEQGGRQIENSAAARRMQLSGSTLKDLNRFGQDLASTEFANAFQRFQLQQANLYNRLLSLANAGTGASERFGTTAGNWLTGFGREGGNTITDIGSMLAAGQLGASDAVSDIIRESGEDTQRMLGSGGGGMSSGSSGGSSGGGFSLGSMG